MNIKEMRISFIQVEFLGPLLRSRRTPSIPFWFLLSGPLFQAQYAQVIDNPSGDPGALCVPWAGDGYAWNFWQYYNRSGRRGLKQDWRALVPLEYRLAATIKPSWAGEAIARTYLYPWGIGVVIDVSLTGLSGADDAVNRALEVRWSAKANVQLNDQTSDKSLTELVAALFDHVHRVAYGTGTSRGEHSELFTIVTAVDGEGASVDMPVASGGDDHKRLEALSGWNTKYKNLNLKPLAENTLGIKGQPPLAHILYGKRRGRTVWFPEYFTSNTEDNRLLIYHENLTMATIQTESLCQLVKDAANLLSSDDPVGQWSVAYGDCAQLAAGLLGRLHGGTLDIYRSKSLQHQIQTSYANAVNTLRVHFNMATLI